MTVNDRQQEIFDDYASTENRQERLGAVVDAARAQPSFPESERTEDRIVPGCTSRVWLRGTLRDGTCHFEADCDSPMVRGLVVLLCACFDGCTPTEAREAQVDVIEKLELWRDLTPTRQNGLRAVRERIASLSIQWS